MKTHRFVRQVEHNELEFGNLPLVEARRFELGTGHVDIGRPAPPAAARARRVSRQRPSFARNCRLIGSTAKLVCAARRGVYGFGRIGRLMARLPKTGGGTAPAPWWWRRRAMMTWSSAALLRRDSIQVPSNGTIRVDERTAFIANGNEVKLIYADAPESRLHRLRHQRRDRDR
jgi:glyceraldehyde 3-phosphate dehydrogenase